MKNFLNKLLIPFAIIHIRIIQYRYKQLTINGHGKHTNQRLALLILLQAKEYYYERMFDSWGKFHPHFSYNNRQWMQHYQFMQWLFPKKGFKGIDIVIWHNPRAVTYYHNKIFRLNGNHRTRYEIEIPDEIKKWNKQDEKRYHEYRKKSKKKKNKKRKHILKHIIDNGRN